jgi:hypothetical protein
MSHFRPRPQVAEFFDPAVNSIIQVIEEESRASSVPIKVRLQAISDF